jgi:hypothetical protein
VLGEMLWNVDEGQAALETGERSIGLLLAQRDGESSIEGGWRPPESIWLPSTNSLVAAQV